jgi:uncharacterized protein (TIGR02270 family)
MPIIRPIVEQHAEEAAFLWLLRDAAVQAPHYTLKDLAELDDRVEAHLDGLRVAGDEGWEISLEGLRHKEPGEVFAAAVLAFERKDGLGIEAVVSAAQTSRENFRALISALGWLSKSNFERWADRLLAANSSVYKDIAIAGCAIQRLDPGKTLTTVIRDDVIFFQARALRAVGEMKRRDLLPELRHRYKSEDDDIQFWSSWSGLILGDQAAFRPLLKFAEIPGRYRERALQLVLRKMDGSSAQNWLKSLATNPDLHRYVLMGAGVVGDPLYVPSLIKKMEVPELARVAGEAFSMITGVDLAYEDLEGEWPEGFEAGPTENPEDDDVAMDPDEDLPWADPSSVQDWWDKNENRFEVGRRYFCGQPISLEHCRHILVNGFQRQRAAAALELAWLQRDSPLFEVRAPGFRQQRLLREEAVLSPLSGHDSAL